MRARKIRMKQGLVRTQPGLRTSSRSPERVSMVRPQAYAHCSTSDGCGLSEHLLDLGFEPCIRSKELAPRPTPGPRKLQRS